MNTQENISIEEEASMNEFMAASLDRWLTTDPKDRYPDPVCLTSERAARKEHRCGGTCGGTIKPGERYLRHWLPPDADHEHGFTWTEHANEATCWAAARME